jgi:hypothetical protein
MNFCIGMWQPNCLSAISVKGGSIKFKNYVCNEKLIYWFLITVYSVEIDQEYSTQHYVMNSVSMCLMLNGKRTLNTHFVFFCFLFHQLVSPLYNSSRSQPPFLYSIFHSTSFQFAKYPDRIFHHFHRRRLPCFQEQMSKWECRILSFNDKIRPLALYYGIISCNITL